MVTGTFGELARETNEGELAGEGGFQGDDGGLDLDLWTFAVAETLAGERDLRGTEILITQVDSEDAHSADGVVRTAAAGRESVLFLRSYPDGVTYAVLGLGAGSLEITDDGLVAPEGADPALVAELARHEDPAAALAAVAAVAGREPSGDGDGG